MELQEIYSSTAAGGAIGSLAHAMTGRLVTPPVAGQRLAPHPVPEVITAAIFAALASRIDGWTQLLIYSWFTAVGSSWPSPT